MSDYMTEGHDKDGTKETTLFDETPFSAITVDNITTDDVKQLIISEAQKIHDTAQSRGTIQADNSVAGSTAVPTEYVSRGDFYYLKVGPVAASAKGLEWRSAYQLDLSEAVEPGSDEFIEITSEWEIPGDSRPWDGVPKTITSTYRHLYKETQTDAQRYVHPEELKANSRVRLPERRYEKAWRYLDKLPGVVGPTDGPAWEYVEEQ